MKRLKNTCNGGELSSNRRHFSGRAQPVVNDSYTERFGPVFSQVHQLYNKFNLLQS
jgi:hypothetical protein